MALLITFEFVSRESLSTHEILMEDIEPLLSV